MKRAALINDLSGVGRCSLTVALPIVSACGYECAVLPTAVLSNHTGFESYTFYDFTDHMPDYIKCWENLGLDFDIIYSGFFGSAVQAMITDEFMSKFGKNAVKLVDPVLGDNGELYSTCSLQTLEYMRHLVSSADIITPNLTELCAVSGNDYPKKGFTVAQIENMCKATGAQCVVVTGLESATVPEIKEGRISNLIYQTGKTVLTDNEKFPVTYCGTGDVFASVISGVVLKTQNIVRAVKTAADFVEICAKDTYNNNGDRLYGMQFENKLGLLKEYCI